MSTTVEPARPTVDHTFPETRPFDEAAWRAWILKGRAQDERRRRAAVTAAKWACIAGLFAAGIWSYFA